MKIPSFTLALVPKSRPGRFLLNGGSVTYPIIFHPEADTEFNILLHNLNRILTAKERSTDDLHLALLRDLGTRLWQLLMPNTIPMKTRAALAEELRKDLLQLHIEVPASLRILPWELLCAPYQYGDVTFLAHRRPIVRIVEGGTELLPLSPPLKILLLISSPEGTKEFQQFDKKNIRKAVEDAIRPFRENGLFYLHVEDVVNRHQIHKALLDFKPHILHYVGRDTYEDDIGIFRGWEDYQKDLFKVPLKDVADLLRPRGLRAALLQCAGRTSHLRYPDFINVDKALTSADIPAILTLQTNFSYESILQTSDILYTVLANGQGMADAAFEIRLALADCLDWVMMTLKATAGGLEPLLDISSPHNIPDPTLIKSDTNMLQFNLGGNNRFEPIELLGTSKSVELSGSGGLKSSSELQIQLGPKVDTQEKFNIVVSVPANQPVSDGFVPSGKAIYINMGDNINFSNISGSNITVKSRLNRVTQTINTLPGVDQSTKDQLFSLVSQLSDTLEQAPQDKKEDAEKISTRLESLVEETKKPKPDKELLHFNLESLMNTAKSIATVLPAVLPLAQELANHISKLIH